MDDTPDVIEVIADTVFFDDVYNSQLLIGLYEDADDNGKALIDRVFTLICGFDLPTLIGMAKKGGQS